MSDFLEFSFGVNDEKIGGKRFDRFKGKEGETYGVSFVWWYTDAKGQPIFDREKLPAEMRTLIPEGCPPPPRFVGAKRFFIENVGYVLDKGPELAKLAGQPSKATIGTIIVIWPTDRNGQLDVPRFQSGNYDVKPWVFSRDKYDMLQSRNTEFPLAEHDLQMKCTDSQYQKMDIVPCKESLFRKLMQSEKSRPVAEGILSMVLEVEAIIRDSIAQDLTVAQVREKMGQSAGASSGSGSGSFSPETTAAVDAILDDVLG